MASYQKSTVRCAILLLLTSAPAFAANKTDIRPIAPTYGQIPLHFEANQGQTDSEVKFLSRGKGYTLFLTPTEAVLSLRKSMKVDKEIIPSADEVGDPGTRTSTVRMKLIGADRDPKITGLEELPGRANYFIGSDPTKWRTDVPLYAKVKYKGVYPGIDLVYYGNQRQLEYDFVVAPGADPDVIRLEFEGSDHIRIDVSGDLVLKTAAEEIRMRKPLVYQSVDDVRQEIAGEYVLLGQMEVGFQVGLYDAAQPLVIDPVLGYSTYHGGSGSDEGSGIAVDGSGNAYVTGGTKSTDFPTANALQPTFGGDRDVVVMKLSADGASLVYSTYLGGSGEDEGARIAVDESGSAYLTGVTDSMNFPTANALQPTFGGGLGGGFDAFVTKLSADGTSLVYSTYLGGLASDLGSGIAVDELGSAYLIGFTDSTDFPTANALQPSHDPGTDAFATKLSADGASLVYSTYLGGLSVDAGLGIAVDELGSAYLIGITDSTDFPTANALQPTFGGNWDAFVTKLSADGTSLVYSTYLGGSSSEGDPAVNEFLMGIAVDESGNAYLSGWTQSSDFPTANALQPTFGGGRDAFVTKLSADGTALDYSTYLGGSGNSEGSGIAVDGSGNAYLSGWTDATDFPTANALQAVFGGGDRDALVAKLTASQKLQITHLGNGGGLQSDVVVFNPSSTTSATGEVNFFGDDGTPLDSSVFLPAGNSFTLQPLGSATLSTNGAGNLFTGSATVTSDTAISAVIRFDITGVGVAGVEASQVLTSAIAPVRRTGTLSSGVAFRNTGSSTIQVTLELKNENGDVVSGGTSTRTLAGNAKIAQFLEDLFPDAQTTTFTGTICVTAQSGQIAVIALELDFFNNVFTTLPVSAVN